MSNTIPANNNTSLYNSTGNAVPTTGNIAANNINATGNVTVGGYIIANGSITTDSNFVGNLIGNVTGNLTGNVTGNLTGNVTGNITLTGGNTEVIYNNSGVTGSSPAFTFNSATNVVTASGNVSANYFLGNGSLLTGIAASYGNANVATFMAAFGSNTISTTGNITSGYVFGNGSQLTGLPATYGNANVAAYLPTYTGNITANVISTTGNIVSAANLVTSGAAGNIVGPNYVSANYFVGNGSLLTNLPAGALAGNLTGNLNGNGYGANAFAFVSATGNVTSGNVMTGGVVSATGNVRGGNINTVGIVTATGNVYGDYFIGNGSQLTGITANYSNSNVTSLMAAFGSNTVSTTGNVTAGNLRTTGQISATGNIAGGNITASKVSAGSFDTPGTIIATTFSGSVVSASGNITGGNINTAGQVSATGNITGNYILGNGSQLTGLGATYSNANVATFMASFGSNTISTTGNITAGYFVGNGSLLTNLTGANVTGSVAQANVANTANAVAGGNVSGQVANALVAGTVTTNAQPNITSLGTLTSVTSTGNVTGGNILTAGLISATGNITGAYFIGNGSQLTGIAASYGNSNVNSLLAAWGSNTISTTGTITAGNVTGGNVLTGGVVSATGNISGNYFIGNGSALTGITATANASGSNTQLQFNDGGAFAGNAAMTFNKTTGNITLGNIVTNTNSIQTVAAIDLANATAFGTTTPWRIQVGNAYNGSANSIYTQTNPGTLAAPTVTPRLLVSDFQVIPNTGLRVAEQSNQLWCNLSANISNTTTRIGTHRNDLYLGGGTSAFSVTATNTPTLAVCNSNQVNIGQGTNANLSLLGNVAWSAGVTGSFNGVTVQNYSSANIIIGLLNQLTVNNANSTVFGNATTQIGMVSNFTGAPANANVTGTTTVVGFYMPGASQIIPGLSNLNGNIARQATDYYSFRSDDTLAKAQLGSLSSFNEFTANVTSSGGTLNVDKSLGQVLQVYPTEAITTVTFNSFITRVLKPNASYANQSDTVTLIIQQGATPYAVTMPTGTAYRYAGGVNTVTATANTTVMISITGTYNYNTAAVQYLITISPAFS
jgi:hypothetical protein